MPERVTHFVNDLKKVDRAKKRLKPKAFIPRDKKDISVVDIDDELELANSHEVIFDIGDIINPGPQRIKARGDMDAARIVAISYTLIDETIRLMLRPDPTLKIPGHHLIYPSFEDLEFADHCAHHLSRISELVLREASPA